MSARQSVAFCGRIVGRRLPSPVKARLKRFEEIFATKPEFVILSTGRAGSTLTSKLLTEAGIPCSHEKFFTASGFQKSAQYLGDSSWLAVPFIEEDKNITNKIVHQVRHPIDVISSLYGIGFFKDESTTFRRFARRNFNATGFELLDCMRWWTDWNLRCERLASQTYKVEDIFDNFSDLITALGYRVKDYQIDSAIRKFSSRQVNARRRRQVTLQMLPDSRDKRLMIETATRYGYDLA